MDRQREQIGSRLGFLLVSAGCAIGLGNVWRFPFITGKYGGAVFLIAYLSFLLLMGLPVLVMEFAVGRAARLNMSGALCKLEPPGTKWRHFGWMTLVGCYLLMMFYMPVAGWMLSYMFKAFSGALQLSQETQNPSNEFNNIFSSLLSSPSSMMLWTLLISCVGFGICAFGVRRGVERITKYMMSGLLLIMVGLAAYAMTLKGDGDGRSALDGLKFYLLPNWQRAKEAGVLSLVNDAMNQAFFTLSVGIGSMCIFGSYLKRERTLTSESVYIVLLDTFVALTAGLIIFPTCFAYGVNPDAGPGLIFVTLPNVFNSMSPLSGRIFGSLFFVFMSVAALTTVVAVVENTIAYFMDRFGWSRAKSTIFNFFVLTILTAPCVLGFNLWKAISIPRIGGILEIEDFIVSNNLLPLGALVFCLFCCSRHGWGWNNFISEANFGKGIKFPQALRVYLTYILPAFLFAVLVLGYAQKFSSLF